MSSIPTPDQLSFLPEDYQHRRIRRRTLGAALGALAVVVIAVGGTLLVVGRSLKQVETEHAEVARLYGDATQRIERLRQQRDELSRVIQRAALARSLTDVMPRSNILAEVTNLLPAGASLSDLSLESHVRPDTAPASGSAFDVKRAALEAKRRAETSANQEVPPQDVIVKVQGLAETDIQVSQYLNKISRSPLFHDVSLLVSETQAAPSSPAATLRRFQIQMTVSPNGRPSAGSGAATAAIGQ